MQESPRPKLASLSRPIERTVPRRHRLPQPQTPKGDRPLPLPSQVPRSIGVRITGGHPVLLPCPCRIKFCNLTRDELVHLREVFVRHTRYRRVNRHRPGRPTGHLRPRDIGTWRNNAVPRTAFTPAPLAVTARAAVTTATIATAHSALVSSSKGQGVGRQVETSGVSGRRESGNERDLRP